MLSRNAADATEHAQEALGEGRSRRRGVLQRRSHQHACRCQDAARDLHWGRGEAGSEVSSHEFLLFKDFAALLRGGGGGGPEPVIRAKVTTPVDTSTVF